MSRTSKDGKTHYEHQKERGLCNIGVLVPRDKRDELIQQADDEGLSLTAYIRYRLFGADYRNINALKRIKNKNRK